MINAGKMAVVMGIETSVPFGCTMKLDVPACSIADIDRQLDEVRKLGVRQMELVNKFDNALSGVAGDTGEVGALVNAANFLETGSFWDMRHCEPADGESHDKNQVAAPGINAEQQDALFGAIAQLGLPTIALPLYPPPDHCNSRGLTTLGEHTIKALAAAAHDLRPRPHVGEGPVLGARHDRPARLPRRRVLALVGDPRRLPADLRGGRVHHAVRRRLHRASSTSGAPTSAGRTRATTGASGTART